MICPTEAVASVPSGSWVVGVSGGADSVALLCLLRSRADLSLHIVHLDHQLRGQASAEDAEFVRGLAGKFGLPCTIAMREQIEQSLVNLPHNPSAKYRALRIELYRRAVMENHLQGVILAHHADDQAETILQRLMRGSGPSGLCGMSEAANVASVLMLRPLLGVHRDQLRQYLQSIGQHWREDVSNESDLYLRNRLRRRLLGRPDLRDALLSLGKVCRVLIDWTQENSQQLPREFRTAQLQRLPRILARESARRWLISQGAKPDELTAQVLDRFIEMAGDAASAPRQLFPGELQVLRRADRIQSSRFPLPPKQDDRHHYRRRNKG